MTKTGKIVYFIVTFIFFVVFNLYFSDLILKYMYDLPKNPVFDLIFVQNYGAAFNILQGSKLFLISFSVVAIIAIVFCILKSILKTSTFTIFFASLLVSGIFNNMLERIIFGFVRDYIKLNFIDFPVFNISDVFINVGVFALVVLIIKDNYSNKKNEIDN